MGDYRFAHDTAQDVGEGEDDEEVGVVGLVVACFSSEERDERAHAGHEASV